MPFKECNGTKLQKLQKLHFLGGSQNNRVSHFFLLFCYFFLKVKKSVTFVTFVLTN